MFKVDDKVRFKPGVTAAYNPNRAGKTATVVRVWSDGGLSRLDVKFNDEDEVLLGLAAAVFEPTTTG